MEKIYDLKISADKISELDLSRILDEKKLLHLHPHWFVGECSESEKSLVVSLKDYETDKEFQLAIQVDFDSAATRESDSHEVMRITLLQFAVSELLFFSEQGMMHVKISAIGDTLDADLEKSMYLWIRSIQEYLRLYTSRKLSALFFRLIMNRMILQMNPSQRKISIMITKITAVEVLVIVVIVVGYFLFVQ